MSLKSRIFPEWIVKSAKNGFKDHVFLTAFVLLIILGSFDLFAGVHFKGLLLFYSVILFVSITRGGYWIWMFKEKNLKK